MNKKRNEGWPFLATNSIADISARGAQRVKQKA